MKNSLFYILKSKQVRAASNSSPASIESNMKDGLIGLSKRLEE